MAIEIPNNLLAAGMLFPDALEGFSPVINARGLEAVDPNSSTDPEAFTGGFVEFAPGAYGVKFLEGIDFTEGVCWAQTDQTNFSHMFIAPQLPELVGASLGDGRSAMITVVDSDGKPPVAETIQFAVTRYASAPADIATIFGP